MAKVHVIIKMSHNILIIKLNIRILTKRVYKLTKGMKSCILSI